MIFVILFIIITYSGLSIVTGMGPKSHFWLEQGIPLFYVHVGIYGPNVEGFYWYNIITDLVIYFVIAYHASCFIIWIYDKVKKK